MKRVLGVLGGMGPAATLDFLQRVQAYTPAQGDQDHIRVLADINPDIPDRNSPGSLAGAVLAEMAGALAGSGAQVLAMPCNTAHAHADLIMKASGLPLIDMIGTAARAAADSGARRVGVLGTRGALKLYREYLAARGLGLITLSPEEQEGFMALVYRIKAGERSDAARAEMRGLAQTLVGQGAECVIAGCTEAPLVLSPGDLRTPLIDAGDLLARRCVSVCLDYEPLPGR